MALYNLFAGIKSTGEPEPKVEPIFNRSSDKDTDLKIAMMDMIGSRGTMKDEDFKELFKTVVNIVGPEKADKIYTSIVGWNTSPQSAKLSPQQRYDTWERLNHNDEYISSLSRKFRESHPMLSLDNSPSTLAMKLTGRKNVREGVKPRGNEIEQIKKTIAPYIKGQ